MDSDKLLFCNFQTSSEGALHNYLIKYFTVNNQVHSRNTRFANLNLVCRKYIRETKGGKSFLVIRACKLRNTLFLELRSSDSLPAFRKSLFNVSFKGPLSLNHLVFSLILI